MSYPINQKINPYSQTSMGVNGINNPQLQDVNVDNVAQGITQNSVLKGVSGNEEEKDAWMTPVITLPVWAAMCLAMDKFNSKCGGEYDKSLVGRVGAWGEKIGNKFASVETFLKKIDSWKTSFKTKIVPKSKILSAYFNTPAKPVNKMALTMSGGTSREIASDAVQKLEKHLKSGGTLNFIQDGKQITDVKQIEAYVKKLSETSHTEDGVKNIIKLCEQQGLEGHTEIKKIGNLKKMPLIGGLFKEDKYLSDIIPGLDKTSRKIYFSEYANKLQSFNNGNTTHLGRVLPKGVLKVVEGLTNGTAGGKVAILMGAYFVADAIKKTIDAPNENGEKRKTFAENLIYNVGWYVTMPLGMALMYRTGGLKYIGMSKDQVEAYRAKLDGFNKSVEAGKYGINDKAKYVTDKKELQKSLKEMLKGDLNAPETASFGKKTGSFLKNLVYKPLKTAANFLTVGLESIKSYNPKGINKESGLLEKAGQFFTNGKAEKLKGVGGGVLRFGLFMFTIAPFLGKIAAKCSHIIFGKPAKSVLDEEKEPEKEQQLTIPQQDTPPQALIAQSNTSSQPQAQQPLVAPMMQPAQKSMNLANSQIVSSDPQDNLVNMYQKTAPTVERNMMTSQEKPVRRYIPSSEGVKYVEDDKESQTDAKVTSLVTQSEKAEKLANKYIN